MRLGAEEAALATAGEAGCRIRAPTPRPRAWAAASRRLPPRLHRTPALITRPRCSSCAFSASNTAPPDPLGQVDPKARQGRRVRHRILQPEPAKAPKLSRSASASSRSRSDRRYPCRPAGTARPAAGRRGQQTAQVLQEQGLELDQRRVGRPSRRRPAHRLQQRLDRLPVHLRR